MNNPFYFTTSIPYVNAQPHLGFALELVQADVLARYYRLLGARVRLQTGTDENATKNLLAALTAKEDTRAFVDRHAAAFRLLATELNIAADDFVRTTELRHREAVQRFWQCLRPGDLYRQHYTGLYCAGCEDFLLPRQLVDGCCPDHLVPPVPIAEDNWFFRLSAYQATLEDLLVNEQLQVVPEERRNEVLAFVRSGLQDISVSRAVVRTGDWGIPVPGDPTQTVYVWIDALVNYLTGPGFGTREDWGVWWNRDVRKTHVIGKNVWKFHAVYWPALLLSAGLPLPDTVLVHGFLTVNGRKIGKSLGNAIDPFACIRDVGVDAVRYYLLRAVPPNGDGDFSAVRLRHLYNADLANGIGNTLSRVTTLAARTGTVFEPEQPPPSPTGYSEALTAFRFDDALGCLWQQLNSVNREIDQLRPWVALKAGQPEVIRPHVARWLATLWGVGVWLSPFLPQAAQRVTAALRRVPITPTASLFPRRT